MLNTNELIKDNRKCTKMYYFVGIFFL